MSSFTRKGQAMTHSSITSRAMLISTADGKLFTLVASTGCFVSRSVSSTRREKYGRPGASCFPGRSGRDSIVVRVPFTRMTTAMVAQNSLPTMSWQSASTRWSASSISSKRRLNSRSVRRWPAAMRGGSSSARLRITVGLSSSREGTSIDSGPVPSCSSPKTSV
ncbi:MAG: hypothetical protein QM820_05135 [Minicystis sp.]